jgi:hypothetical protein
VHFLDVYQGIKASLQASSHLFLCRHAHDIPGQGVKLAALFVMEQELEKWCNEAGIEAADLTVAEFDGGTLRGIAATSPISVGQVICRIPLHALVCLHNADECPAFSAACQQVAVAPADRIILAAFLLHQRARPSSPWRAYLNALPQEHTILGTFPVDILKELQVCLFQT